MAGHDRDTGINRTRHGHHMKEIQAYPPNYEKILAAFPAVKDQPHVIFTYGNAIYNPSGKYIPPEKIAHEQVHMVQQLEVGQDWWWETYCNDKAFRLQEEIPANRIDYKVFCENNRDRNQRADYLHWLAGTLAGPLYGNMLTLEEAKKTIKNG